MTEVEKTEMDFDGVAVASDRVVSDGVSERRHCITGPLHRALQNRSRKLCSTRHSLSAVETLFFFFRGGPFSTAHKRQTGVAKRVLKFIFAATRGQSAEAKCRPA